ncbi:hypothetical protein P7K49_013580 [Saguinus oedipus]|uniref:Uncharacterized protein n=1 Tax=Saguinus oedipus TaxID=9490 RepID=A0ABQ9VGV0_SAGOE|nr:hypothetical protein P7K49_013580 [Saguinus oedipus]
MQEARGLGNVLSSARIRAGRGAGTRGSGWTEERKEEVAKKQRGPPSVVAGIAGDRGRGGLSFRAGRGLRAQDADLGAPRSRLAGRPQRGSAPPPPGPAAVTRPPSGAPSPPCPLPAPPAPGALTWKRFFTHSFFMAGEGAGPAAGRGGDGRGRGGLGSGREPARSGGAAAAALESAPPPPACTPPGAPSLFCPPTSPGAALTCLPMQPPATT